MQFGIVDNRFLAKSVGMLNPPTPIFLNRNDSVKRALEHLKTSKLGCVLINDDNGKLVGIFSERDAILKTSLAEIDATNTSIFSLMTPNPQTATMTTSIAFVLNMMSHGGYRNVPIVDDTGCAIGIVTVKHIVDYLAGTLAKDLVSFT